MKFGKGLEADIIAPQRKSLPSTRTTGLRCFSQPSYFSPYASSVRLRLTLKVGVTKPFSGDQMLAVR